MGRLPYRRKIFRIVTYDTLATRRSWGNQGGARGQVREDQFAQPEEVYGPEVRYCRSIAEAIRVKMAPYDAMKGSK